MAGEHIYIVEDEKIVAEDLKRMLERLGYTIVGSASNGEQALKQMETTRPHLVLMDIRIQGPLDGIEVAEHLFARFDVPVIYLTAYADELTVDRAKGTLASGYILKPFEERGLKTAIELALYRHKMDRMMKSADDWHGGILENLNVAVVAVDTKGIISYMNKLAEDLTGLPLDKLLGKALASVFSSESRLSDHTPSQVTLERQGHPISIDCVPSPVMDLEGNLRGTALVLRESTP